MTTAAQLLRQTDKTLDQLAAAVGYGSAFAFAKAFRRAYATTPGTYRNASRTGLTDTATPGPVVRREPPDEPPADGRRH
jgi:AraC-like DNA-binding protein